MSLEGSAPLSGGLTSSEALRPVAPRGQEASSGDPGPELSLHSLMTQTPQGQARVHVTHQVPAASFLTSAQKRAVTGLSNFPRFSVADHLECFKI